MKTINKLLRVTCLSLVISTFSLQVHGQFDTKVKTGSMISGKIDLSNKTPVLIATRKDVAKSIPSKKLKKVINRKVTDEFADKIPSNYRPKSGKLNANLNPQKPFTPRAYIEFPNGKYQPMQRLIGLNGQGWVYGGDLFVKFRTKPGMRYLVRLKINTADKTHRAMNEDENPIIYSYLGDTQTTFALEKSFGILTNKEYTFDLIVHANSNNWIQVPFSSGLRNNGSSVSYLPVPWNFVSASVSEL